MVDEMYDRQYQAGRAELHAGIDRLARSVLGGFEVLNRIQFAAPWAKRTLMKKDRVGVA